MAPHNSYTMYRRELESLITQVLNERGLSDREAGRAAGLHHSTVGTLRKGEVPSRETLGKFARAFSIPERTILQAAGGLGIEYMTRKEIAKEFRGICKRIQALTQMLEEAE